LLSLNHSCTYVNCCITIVTAGSYCSYTSYGTTYYRYCESGCCSNSCCSI